MTQQISIFGATGSIGESALKLIDQHTDYQLFAALGGKRWQIMLEICQQFSPQYVSMADIKALNRLREACQEAHLPTKVLDYDEVLSLACQSPAVDTVIAGISGAAGLPSVMLAAQGGKRIALANKEPLVMAGALLKSLAQKHGAIILPTDSEHNALFQCLPSDRQANVDTRLVKKLWLTASGGPFLHTPITQFAGITPEMAVKHPKWSMGQKISIDSATMMNKGLELIEAMHLFDLPATQIDAVVHPQSTVHSFVEYLDGSFLAQLGATDMRIPIAYAMSWPSRIETGVAPLTPMDFAQLDFLALDRTKFRCFSLAEQAMRSDHLSMVALNAANEIAVTAFLDKSIRFTEIADVVETALNRAPTLGISAESLATLEGILAADRQIRVLARETCVEIC